MSRSLKMLLLLVAVALVPGCETMGGGEKDEPAEPAGVEDRSGQAGADTSGVAGGTSFAGNELDDPSSPLSTRIIYFDYDSGSVRADDHQLISAHAGYLASHPGVQIVLEGHADERGSREYNIALGERRAQSVEQLLVLQGASSSQIETVSYGEEKPAVSGFDEDAWQQNRRVEIVYPQP